MNASTSIALALLAATILGCGDSEPKRVVVQGEVSFRGKPVNDGEIRLYPKAGTQAPMNGALIRDGRYVVDARKGMPPGTFRVEVTAYRSRQHVDGGSVEKESEGTQYLPARFNSDSQLELIVPEGSPPITHNLKLEE